MNKLNLEKSKSIHFRILVLGLGGTGSHFARTMMQIISGLYASNDYNNKAYCDVFLADGDKVERKNFHRQLFDKDDLDSNKAVSIKERYGFYYEIETHVISEYIKTTDMINRIFKYKVDDEQYIPIIIGALDNNRSRQVVDQFFYNNEYDDLIWIDAGIEGVVPYTTNKEKEFSDRTGYSGQVVIGLKWAGEVILEPVTRVYPDMLDETEEFPDAACGTTVVNHPQRLITNQMAAHSLASVLNLILHDKMIYVHKIVFNNQTMCMESVAISNNQNQHFLKLMK